MDSSTATADIDALKERHRVMWGLGDYALVADTVIPHLGGVLVDHVGVAAGDRVLDVAAGTGNAALPAARRGAHVTAVDLSDGLVGECERRARSEGLEVETVTGDAESLPLPDGSFDVVLSCVGVMFAPRHQVAADEMVRVCRPGGRIALLSWTPDGFVGRLLATIRPFVPAPPAGAEPPAPWGDPDHVAALLANKVADLSHTRGAVRVDCFTSPTAFRELFKTSYGPTVAAYRGLADDPARSAELDAALDALAAGARAPDASMTWAYLVTTATRL